MKEKDTDILREGKRERERERETDKTERRTKATMPTPSVVLATAGYDHTIRFWEAPSGICYRTLQHTDSQVNVLEITPDKRYLAAAGNPHVRLFDIVSNSPHPFMSFDGHTHNVTSVGLVD